MVENDVLLEWEGAARLAEVALGNLAFNLHAHRVRARSVRGCLGGDNFDVLLAQLKAAGLESWLIRCDAGGGVDRLAEVVAKRKDSLGYHNRLERRGCHVYVGKEAT